ncbi:MAG: alkaline phosphatase, partial [Gemmatimonadales bacterium]
PNLCTLAYFHRPLFSSGTHGGSPEVGALWQILYDGGVDLVLNGHDHHYERFHPQTPAGVMDSVRGIEQIIAGTGGGDLRGVRPRRAGNSIGAIRGRFGVLKLSLGRDDYSSAFIDTTGRIWDPAVGKCH